MIAGDVILAPEMGSSAAGEALLAHASEREAVRQTEEEHFQRTDAPGAAGPTHSTPYEATLSSSSCLHDPVAAQSSRLTLLDVAVAWRKQAACAHF